MNQKQALVQAQLEAYNNRDLETFCMCFHPEVEVTNFVSNKIVIKGMEEFRKIYSGLFENNPELNCQLKSRIILADVIMDEEFVTGNKSRPNGSHTVAVYGFRDGLIDRVWFPK